MYKDAKNLGMNSLKGYYIKVFAGTLLYLLIRNLTNILSYFIPTNIIVTIVSIIASIILSYGYIRFIIKIYNKEDANVLSIFYGFKHIKSLMIIGMQYITKFIIPVILILLAFFYGSSFSTSNFMAAFLPGEDSGGFEYYIAYIALLFIAIVLMAIIYLRYFYVLFIYAEGNENEKSWKDIKLLFKKGEDVTEGYLLKILSFIFISYWWAILIIIAPTVAGDILHYKGLIPLSEEGLNILISAVNILLQSCVLPIISFGYIGLYNILKNKVKSNSTDN